MILSVLLATFEESFASTFESQSAGLGKWKLPAEERERALVLLKKQWSRNPHAPALALELSNLLFLAGRREEAVRTLLLTHSLMPTSPQRSKVEGRVRVLSRSFISEEGARSYQAALNALLEGNGASAVARLDSVIAAERYVLDAVVRKGQAEVLLSRWDSAAETFRLARSLNPFEPEVRLWLGYVLIARGEKDEGQQEILGAWRSSTQKQRERPHWRAWTSRALALSGRSGAAKAVLDENPSPRNERWTERSGWNLWASSFLDPARFREIRKFLNLFPHGYQRLLGNSGLDLDWWDPRVFERPVEGFAPGEPESSTSRPGKISGLGLTR